MLGLLYLTIGYNVAAYYLLRFNKIRYQQVTSAK
jgi:hypothetical protein